MSFDSVSDYPHSQESSYHYGLDSQSDHVYSGFATGQFEADFTGEHSGMPPLSDAQIFKSKNESAQTAAFLYHPCGSLMDGLQLTNEQEHYRINDIRPRDGIEPPHSFNVPINPTISQAVGQVHPNTMSAWGHRPGDYLQLLHQCCAHQCLGGPPDPRNGQGFHLSSDQEIMGYQAFLIDGCMDPSLQMSPVTAGHTHANAEQPIDPYGVYTSPPSGETHHVPPRLITMFSRRPVVQAHNTAVVSAQSVVHEHPTALESQAEQFAFTVPQHGSSLPRHHHLSPPLPAALAFPLADVLPAFIPRDMQPDGITVPTFQTQNIVNHRLLPSTYTSVTNAVSAKSTRQRPKKHIPEGEGHSRICGWNSTCTVKVHLANVRDHLRTHMEDVGGVDTHCRYADCNKVLRKDGLARHYLTHFGTRVECCGCEKDFARPDEITRGHRTKDKIRCSSRRWRRFIVDDNGSKHYI